MNFQDHIPFSIRELSVGSILLILSFILVFTSRNIRLHSEEAFVTEEKLRLVLEEQQNLDELIVSLIETDVRFNEQELRWAARLLGWRYFRKGSYELDGAYGYEELLSRLARGLQDPVRVVVLPGIDQKRFAADLSRQIEAPEKEIYSMLTDSNASVRFGYQGQDLFGRMLPETYLVYWTIEPEELIKRVLKEFESNVEDRFSNAIDSISVSMEEVLTMASIVEWEAKMEEEKPVIAGLYWNRIERRMNLQADPTVNFALGERRRLLFEDYKFEHPYNTYVNRGLPPGPITNPSLETIRATIFYQDHDYLYMVANPEGGHVFTRTFAEHQRESEKWRQWLREQYRIKRRLERENATESDAEG